MIYFAIEALQFPVKITRNHNFYQMIMSLYYRMPTSPTQSVVNAFTGMKYR